MRIANCEGAVIEINMILTPPKITHILLFFDNIYPINLLMSFKKFRYRLHVYAGTKHLGEKPDS